MLVVDWCQGLRNDWCVPEWKEIGTEELQIAIAGQDSFGFGAVMDRNYFVTRIHLGALCVWAIRIPVSEASAEFIPASCPKESDAYAPLKQKWVPGNGSD